MEEHLTITEKIHDFIEFGILNEVDKIERHLGVWDSIAEKIEDLKECDEQVQELFIHLQYCASDTFVLSLGKIFDRPSNSNTRCLAKIFSVVKQHKKDFPPGLISRFEIEKLKKVNCPSAILVLLKNPSPKLCIQICDYYIKILESPDIADKINHVYTARDKFVAHSELVTEGHNLKITAVKELTEIALEFCNVFNLIFMKGGYFRDPKLTSYLFIKKAISEYANVD